jgi:hypothetical protein
MVYTFTYPAIFKKISVSTIFRQMAVKPLLKLTLAPIMLEFLFLDTMTSNAVQIISKIIFACHWWIHPPKRM